MSVRKTACQVDVTLAPFLSDVNRVNKNVEWYGVCKITLRHWNSASVFGFGMLKCTCFCVVNKEIKCQTILQLSLPFVIQILAEYYMLKLDYFLLIKNTL